MAVEKKKPVCALCGQAVEIKGFDLKTETGKLSFCCAGCLSIYPLLNDNKTLTDSIQTKKKR
ncbi:MAG: metal-binding protein [Gammaproteobacteria bacterium HGW-Gammaproteobacteria-3]|nr:MAG: metal-binding protein [Gammaproteobacteria bacterium HGW-Gammaproteobacteria-3]